MLLKALKYVGLGALLAVPAICAPATSGQKDPESEPFQLHAYGNFNNSGARVFFADGQGWVGTTAPSDATTSFNMTFLLNSTATTIAWTPENYNGTVDNSTELFYINDSEGANDHITFGSSDANTTSIGFGMYGQWVYHVDDGDLTMKWWVTETEDGLYKLTWNNAGSTDGTGVSLRSTPPPEPKEKF